MCTPKFEQRTLCPDKAGNLLWGIVKLEFSSRHFFISLLFSFLLFESFDVREDWLLGGDASRAGLSSRRHLPDIACVRI